MTNAGFLLPARASTTVSSADLDAGTLLAIDETHTLVNGLRRADRSWGLDPDFLTRREVDRGRGAARRLRDAGRDQRRDRAAGASRVTSPGSRSTRFRRAARCSRTRFRWRAGRAALTEVLTEDAFERTGAPRRSDGGRPAGTIRERQPRLERGPARRARLLLLLAPSRRPTRRPRDAADDPDLRALIRVFMANRGVWESGLVARADRLGRPASDEDVDPYLAVFAACLAATRG